MEYVAFFFLFFLVFVGARLWETHMRTKRAGLDGKEYQAMQSRLAELEDRVRVLERIVTDRNVDLEREFRGLAESHAPRTKHVSALRSVVPASAHAYHEASLPVS